MSFIATAIASAGASQLVGGLIGGATGAAGSAAGGAASAQGNAQALQNAQQIAQTQAGLLQPYQTLGSLAAGQLSKTLNANQTGGPGGAPGLLSTFNAADLNANLAPNYQFGLSQGQGQLQNAAAAAGGAFGGNAQSGLNAFSQNYAQNAYQNAFNNFQTQQSNIYNRLSGIAGLGANTSNVNATGTVNQAGLQGQFITGQGNAVAQGIAGGTNALVGGINQATSGTMLSDLAQGFNSTNTGNYIPGTNNGISYAQGVAAGIQPM